MSRIYNLNVHFFAENDTRILEYTAYFQEAVNIIASEFQDVQAQTGIVRPAQQVFTRNSYRHKFSVIPLGQEAAA